MRLVQMKGAEGLFWTEEYRLLKIGLMDAEAGIPWMQQPIDPMCKEFSEQLEPLHNCSLNIFIQ
jgi:hypothetical protein